MENRLNEIEAPWAAEGSAWSQRREIAFGKSITAETIPGLTVTLPE